jgi:uncharacterized protein YkwD
MRSVAVVLCTLSSLPLLAVAVPAATAAGPSWDPGERAIVRAVNRVRARHGLPFVRPHAGLAAAADAHSAEMIAAGYFGHGAMAQRVRRYARFKRVGETLAWSRGFHARSIVRMWMRSSAHRKVLLRRSYRRIGVGRRASSRIAMITADFGARR